jgi:hypothetical protein
MQKLLLMRERSMRISKFRSGEPMMKPPSGAPIAGRTSRLRRSFFTLAASLFALAASLLAFPALAQGSPAPTVDCRTLVERLGKLMAVYRGAAAEALNNQPLDVAMERARKEALAGKKEATITMVGYSSLIYAREGSFPITTVRQVCTFASRNALPLHLVTCAYFNALNPLGEAEAKARAAHKLVAQFEALTEPPAELGEHMNTLKACLPQKE